jgi:hypothetical protein
MDVCICICMRMYTVVILIFMFQHISIFDREFLHNIISIDRRQITKGFKSIYMYVCDIVLAVCIYMCVFNFFNIYFLITGDMNICAEAVHIRYGEVGICVLFTSI